MLDPRRLRRAYETARRDLLAERDESGHWIGELSTSALSTATAASALAVVQSRRPAARFQALISRAVEWLAAHQNEDGGWGDTDKSLSNIATTMLVRAAFHLAGVAERHRPVLDRAERYIERCGGMAGLRRRYGKDKTFAVPILANCALAGLVSWADVSPLPFEVAALPNRLLGLLRVPVVSYAIPALVAIGQARYFHRKPWNPITRWIRRRSVEASLRVVERMLPQSGGFLEAAPLTSFVTMSLASIGRHEHPIVERAVEFLVNSVLPDGSWPIDTNLATWVTSLSVNALDAGGEDVGQLDCLDWLLSCQHREVHPYTSAEPGGWAWTHLSGGVPDADDTPGALLALAAIRKSGAPDQEAVQRIDAAASMGIRWLLNLQNSDGGWPTFCRGWGALPFDRSGTDLTAHVLRAFHTWLKTSGTLSKRLPEAMRAAMRRGSHFLTRQQRPDGSWVPLWFGNQHHPSEENPVYGTARALLAYRDLGLDNTVAARRGGEWLVARQGKDGGWGGWSTGEAGNARGESTTEETALAVEALLGTETNANDPAVERGVGWLIDGVESGNYREASPIGLYFAKLWYYEKLYPMIFTVSALGRAATRYEAPIASSD